MWNLKHPPRRWQIEALDRWRMNGRHGVVSVVTGGGKTIFAFQCLVDARVDNPNLRTVILVPTLALLDQWYVSLQDDLGVSESEIGLYSGESTPPSPCEINIMVINTARAKIARVANGADTLLVVDECHRAASEANSRVFEANFSMSLGLSATPERDYDDLFQDVVVPSLGPIIFEYDYNQARKDGVVTPFELANVKVVLSASEQSEYDKLTKRIRLLFKRRESGESVDLQLQRLLILRSRVSTRAMSRYPATIKILERHRQEKAIVFHEQIESAEIIGATLKTRGHRVATYHSALGASLRQDNLRMFRRGEIDILVTCRALDEGINVPNASIAVIAASTSSTRQRIQRLGRVLRPATGKEMAVVYTIYATEPEKERLKLESERVEGADKVRWLQLAST